MDDAAFERYSRHINLARIGFDGQLAIANSHVAIVGAGGLGCPAALYLSAAGVGRVTLIDDDTVELSNLQRQIGHDSTSTGEPKVVSLRQSCLDINPTISIDTVAARLDSTNVAEQLAGADLVLDGSDNLGTRQTVNAACATLGKKLITASAIRFEGQIAVLAPGTADSACYRCLYPESLGDQENCRSAGVIGPLVGVLGSYMALEAVKQLVGAGQNSIGKLWLFDALENQWHHMQVARKADCPVCGDSGA